MKAGRNQHNKQCKQEIHKWTKLLFKSALHYKTLVLLMPYSASLIRIKCLNPSFRKTVHNVSISLSHRLQNTLFPTLTDSAKNRSSWALWNRPLGTVLKLPKIILQNLTDVIYVQSASAVFKTNSHLIEDSILQSCIFYCYFNENLASPPSAKIKVKYFYCKRFYEK